MQDVVVVVLAQVFGFAVAIAIGRFAERMRPVQRPESVAIDVNLKCMTLTAVTHAAMYPLICAGTVLTVNALGGGLIALPATGWSLAAGILIYTVTMDAGEYVFHRAQHRFSILWAMHSLHHSDTSVNVSTTLRHFWAEELIKVLTVYLIIGCVFRVSAAILTGYGLIRLYNFVPHLNLRLGFGPLSFLLNSPQYHRIHHSVLTEHHNSNFAALFPLFDVVFGTYTQPKRNEFPPTGLDGRVAPIGFADAAMWPLRRHFFTPTH